MLEMVTWSKTEQILILEIKKKTDLVQRSRRFVKKWINNRMEILVWSLVLREMKDIQRKPFKLHRETSNFTILPTTTNVLSWWKFKALDSPNWLKYFSKLSQSNLVLQNMIARSIFILSIAFTQYSPFNIFTASDKVSVHNKIVRGKFFLKF